MTPAPLAPGESIFTPREYQKRAIEDKGRFKAYMWSRQTGKGFAVALEVNDDILESEARGEATDWMIVSRSLIAARQLGRKVRGIGRAMTAAIKAVEPSIEDLGESQLELTYPGGSRVLILSSSPDAAVGFTGNVVIDEIDTHKQAFELFGNTFPVVSTGKHRLIVTSTPRGRRVMHRIFSDSKKEGSPWSFHTLNIHQAIEQGCDQDAELLRRGILDELKWRQEYLCEFVDDEICWIPWELIAGCTSDLAAIEPKAGDKDDGDGVYAGWDVARWNHLSVLWLIRKKGTALVTCGVLVMQRTPFDEQIARIDKALRLFPNARRLCVDSSGIGEMPFEQASKRLNVAVEGVKFTGPVKESLASDLRRVMEDRSLYIPDDEGIHNDFHSLRRTMTAAGNARFEGEAEGSHADRFWAAALAIHAAIGQPIDWSVAGVVPRKVEWI
jgi:phage FluMu gp28-like protein